MRGRHPSNYARAGGRAVAAALAEHYRQQETERDRADYEREIEQRGGDTVNTHRSKAQRDEECNYCAYPFDTGDVVLRDEDETPFCSGQCAKAYNVWRDKRDAVLWPAKEVTP